MTWGFDSYEIDEPDDYRDEDEDFGPRPKTCKRCGVSDLYWYHVRGQWKLHDIQGRLHRCTSAAPASPDDFEDLA